MLTTTERQKSDNSASGTDDTISENGGKPKNNLACVFYLIGSLYYFLQLLDMWFRS